MTRALTDGITFGQGSEIIGSQSTNYYYCLFDKNSVKLNLFSSTYKYPLHNIVIDAFNKSMEQDYVIGINTNTFLITDDDYIPKNWSYHLNISDGILFQLPANARPTIITQEGKIIFKTLKAEGSLLIGNKVLNWQGSYNFSGQTDTVIYGAFDIPQSRIEKDGKVFIFSRYDSSWIKAEQGEKLLGFNLTNGKVKVETISKNKLNLFDYLFILKGRTSRLQGITINNEVRKVIVDHQNLSSGLSAQSLMSKLPKNKRNISKVFRKFLIPSNNLKNNGLKDFRKAWSVILKTQNQQIAFFITDARPKVKGQEGLNIFELHSLLSKNFNFSKAFIADAGQSSRICIYNGHQCQVYGNLHYLDYKQKPPVWKGKDGRFIPGALLSYHQSTNKYGKT